MLAFRMCSMSTEPMAARVRYGKAVTVKNQSDPNGRSADHFFEAYLEDAILVLIIHTGGRVMSRTTSITIGSQLDDFVRELIKSGRYGSTSEVVRSALRLLERQEKQVAALRIAVEAGERSGESDLSLRDIAAQVKQKHNV